MASVCFSLIGSCSKSYFCILVLEIRANRAFGFLCKMNEKVMEDVFSNFKVLLIELMFCVLDIYIKIT